MNDARETVDTLVIGAGQAGVAVAELLAHIRERPPVAVIELLRITVAHVTPSRIGHRRPPCMALLLGWP
jgi:L-2-hydroxyglutarate oxidase LhgO